MLSQIQLKREQNATLYLHILDCHFMRDSIFS